MTRQSMVWLLGAVVGFLALLVADPTEAQNAVLWDTLFAVAFVVQACVAELWIRATRRSGALSARKVKAA